MPNRSMSRVAIPLLLLFCGSLALGQTADPGPSSLVARLERLRKRAEYYGNVDRLRARVHQTMREYVADASIPERCPRTQAGTEEHRQVQSALDRAERAFNGVVRDHVRECLVRARDGQSDIGPTELSILFTEWVEIATSTGLNPFDRVPREVHDEALLGQKPEAIRQVLQIWFKDPSATGSRPGATVPSYFPKGTRPPSPSPASPIEQGTGEPAEPARSPPGTGSEGPAGAPGQALPVVLALALVAALAGGAVLWARSGRAVPRPAARPQRPAPAKEDPNADGLVALGLSSLRKCEYERAIARFQAVIKSDASRADAARGWMVVALLKQGHCVVAQEELCKLPQDAVDTELLYELADASENAGLSHQALQLFRRIYARDVQYRDVAHRVKTLTTPLEEVTRTGLDPKLEVERIPKRYTCPALLSRGGMGVILTAIDRDLNRKVAIKLLAPELRSNEAFVARFYREAQAIAAISHPSIVQIFDVQREPIPFFIMEYVDGQGLDRYLQERTSFDFDSALVIGRQIGLAVECLHSKGIVHRDIKPANVLLQDRERVKLVDFGLALSEEWRRITQPRTVLGTPRYMAPEVVGGNAPDARADLFSVGVILFELLVGRYPFDGPGLFPQLTVAAPPAAQAAPIVPLALATLVDACLERDPKRRPSTASMVVAALTAELVRVGRIPT